MRLCCYFFWFVCVPFALQSQVQYTLRYTDTTAGKVMVTIEPARPMPTPVTLVMPRSVPGAYNILLYDYFIGDIKARGSDGKNYKMEKDGNGAPRWSCTDSAVLISNISYEVNLEKMERQLLSPADASITRPGFAGLLNYSIFGWLAGTEQNPVQCRIQTIDGWPIFSTNAPAAEPAKGTFQFSADSYFTLADGQLFLGPAFRVKEYKGLVPLFIVAYSETDAEYLDDYGWQETTSMSILQEYFGSLPFKNYSAMLRKAKLLEPDHLGGLAMEHLNSSTFFGDVSTLRTKPMSEEDMLRTMPTYLHHMSHAFIPLRCFGDAYRPHVLEIAPIINDIWFNEGFMWFLAYDTLHTAAWKALFDKNAYGAASAIRRMSLQELSQTASTQYGTDFRLGRAVYSRGALMAIEMNTYIKEKTAGKKSMRDVFRYLYRWAQTNKRAFTMQEIPSLLNEASGVDVSVIYNKWQAPFAASPE
jgi:predicted metalloprotease with PDZ domain